MFSSCFPHVTREVCGLWLQMALCEHSCEPNCSLVHVHYPAAKFLMCTLTGLDGLSVPTAEDGTDLWFVALRNIPEGSAAAKRNLHLASIFCRCTVEV